MVATKLEKRATDPRHLTMKAVVRDEYGSADVVHLGVIATPEIGDDEVLVKVHAAGLDRGVWHLMAGLPYMVRLVGYGLRKPKNPVLGSDLAGVVEAVGKNVTRFRCGDEVFGFGMGSFAEYARAKEKTLALKPANLTFEQAAALPISAATALQGLREAGRIQPGQKVLIIGASGGVGTYAVQLAKAFGADVTGVSSTGKLDLVRSIGADHVIDYTREDFAGGQRYDLILDIGGDRPLSQLRRALTPKGTLVIVGGEGGGRWFGLGRQLRALATSPFVSQRLTMFIAKQRYQDYEFLIGLVEAGKIKPTIDKVFPLTEVADAIRYLEAGRARGKVVITV